MIDGNEIALREYEDKQQQSEMKYEEMLSLLDNELNITEVIDTFNTIVDSYGFDYSLVDYIREQ